MPSDPQEWWFKDRLPRRSQRVHERLADQAAGFAFNVQWLAERRRLSIKELSRRAGLSERAIWDILRQRASPRLATILVLAHALRVRPAYLLLNNRELTGKVTRRKRSSRTESK
jgi:DNA-binding phage protein